MTTDRLNLQLPKGRMAYLALAQPKKKKKPTDNDKWGWTHIYDPATATPEDKARQAAIEKACRDLKAAQPGGGQGYKLPFHKGGEVDAAGDPIPWLNRPEMIGKIVYAVGSINRPINIARRDKSLIDLATSKGEVYAGMYGTGFVTPYAYTNESKGINLGVNSALKLEDGEPLGFKSDPTEDFRDFDADAEYGPVESMPNNAAAMVDPGV